jgi:formate/nitrite transporter
MTTKILYEVIDTGKKKILINFYKLIVLAILAGFHIGLGSTLSLMVGGDLPLIKTENPGLQRLIAGIYGFPFGLYMCIVMGSNLFTSNVAIMILCILEKTVSRKNFMYNWLISYFGNFIGSVLLALLIYYSEIISNKQSIIDYMTYKTEHTFIVLILRGIICNILVCFAVYMSYSKEKFISIFGPISMFISFGADHCVANMFGLTLGLLLGADYGIKGFFHNLIPVTIGNIIGGGLVSISIWFPYNILVINNNNIMPL